MSAVVAALLVTLVSSSVAFAAYSTGTMEVIHSKSKKVEAQGSFSRIAMAYGYPNGKGSWTFMHYATGTVKDMLADKQSVFLDQIGYQGVYQSSYLGGGMYRYFATWAQDGAKQSAHTESSIAKTTVDVPYKKIGGNKTGNWRSQVSVCVDVKWAPDSCTRASYDFNGLWP
jgi:hypothetical protein